MTNNADQPAKTNPFFSFFTAGNPDPSDIETMRKAVLVNVIVAIGFSFLLPYGIIALRNGRPTLALFDLGTALLLLAASIYSRTSNNLTFGKYFSSIAMSLLYIYLVATGATGNTGHLWIFTQPLFVLFLLGKRSGLVVWGVFFFMLVLLLAIPDNPLLRAPYTTDFRIRLLSAFLAVFIVAYAYEYTREWLYRHMLKKHAEQNTMLADLLHAQTAMHESENRLRDISLSSSDWIWEVDEAWMFRFVSGRVQEGLGYAADDLIGISLYDLIADEDRDSLRRRLGDGMASNGKVTDLPCWITRRDGVRVYLSLSAVAVTGPDAKATGYRGVGKDITAIKKADEDRARIEENLRTAQKMEAVGQLAGGIAHDFNNILGSISGYAEMISRRVGDGDPKLRKYAETILSASARAADLTSKLLAFARKGKFQTVLFNTHHIIGELVDLLRLTVDKRISVTFTPNAASPMVHGDPTQVRNIMLNLGLNARDAMPDGGTLVFTTDNMILDGTFQHARKYEVVCGSYLCITVSDTGSGMDESTLARLFEPFFTTKDIGKGTGLGLASVYGTVKSHRGYIDVDSKVGAGTTFRLYFPCSPAEATAPASEPSPVQNPAMVHGTGTVLIIDDEKFLIDISKDMLEKLGYAVIGFVDAEKGIEYYRAHPREIALAIIDMTMPLMNGRECFRRLREIHPDVKAVLSTGYNLEGETSDILKEGFISLLQKPFVMTVLANTVANAIKG